MNSVLTPSAPCTPVLTLGPLTTAQPPASRESCRHLTCQWLETPGLGTILGDPEQRC